MPGLSGAMPEGLDAARAAVLADLDLYLDEGDRLIRQAETVRGAMEQAGAPEGHRLLAAQILLAMDRLQHGMRRHRAALAPDPEPAILTVPPRRPWRTWFGSAARSSA